MVKTCPLVDAYNRQGLYCHDNGQITNLLGCFLDISCKQANFFVDCRKRIILGVALCSSLFCNIEKKQKTKKKQTNKQKKKNKKKNKQTNKKKKKKKTNKQTKKKKKKKSGPEVIKEFHGHLSWA